MTATIPQITEPGVYDLPAEVYHHDPVKGGSLSSSGAKKLIPPSCPARFWYERHNGQPPKKAFEFGQAAHSMVLGAGPELVVVDAVDWRTKAAKEQKATITAAGGIAVLDWEYAEIERMAEALREHPVAQALLRRDRGRGEQTLVWRDASSGVWCRALLDWLPHPQSDRRVILVDYKTTRDASPEGISKAVNEYGYHQQADWYLSGLCALGLNNGHEPAFVFVFQEKTPPYLVTVVELDRPALQIGAAKNRRAREVYRACAAAGRWPGYSDEVELLSLPTWAEINDTKEYL